MARPREFDESDVVAAARDEFWSRGYAATSVDDLTTVTGLGKGSLYGAFGDKHGLFLRALDDYIGTALDGVRAQLRDPRHSAYDRLARHIRAQARDIAADKSRRGCMMAKSAAELSATDDDRGAGGRACLRDMDAQNSPTASKRRSATERSIRGRIRRRWARPLLAFMRGQEALHKGGVKPAQLKASAEQMIALIPTGWK